MKKIIVIACLASLLPVTALAKKQYKALSTTVNFVSFDGGSRKAQYVPIKNVGTHKAFVVLKTTRLDNPGMKNEIHYANKNPKKLGLLVSPSKIILKPGKARKAKVLPLVRNNKKDVVFVISGDQIKMPGKKIKHEGNGIGLSVDFSIGTRTIVVVRPKKLDPKLQEYIDNGDITFKNTGNTTLTIDRVKQCLDDTCHTISSIGRLYPNNEKTKKLPESSSPVTFRLRYPGHEEIMTAKQ